MKSEEVLTTQLWDLTLMIAWFNKFEGFFLSSFLILSDVIYFSKKYQMSSLVHMNAKA